MAARRAGADSHVRGDRGIGSIGCGQWRRVFRAGVRGTGRAALGSVRSGIDFWADSRDEGGPPGKGSAGEYRVSGCRPAGRGAVGYWYSAAGAAGGWRRREQ